MMPDLLKVTSNIGYLLLMAFVFYWVFCALFVYSLPVLRSRLSDIGWKKVDYVWLAAAVAGLALQSEQVRTAWFTSDYESYKLDVSSAEFDVKRYARDLTNGYFCNGLDSNSRSADSAEVEAEEFRRACAQFEVFKIRDMSVPLYYDMKFATAAEHAYEIIPLYESAEIKKRLNRLNNAYKRYDELLDGLNESRRKTEPFEFEVVLHWFSPLLLALALALRFAKVTGEIRLKNHPVEEIVKPIVPSEVGSDGLQSAEGLEEDKKGPPEGGQMVTEKPVA